MLMTLGHACPSLSSSPRQVWKSPIWAQVCGGWKHCPGNVSGPPPSFAGPPKPRILLTSPRWWRRRRRALRPGWGDHLLQEQCLCAPLRGCRGWGNTTQVSLCGEPGVTGWEKKAWGHRTRESWLISLKLASSCITSPFALISPSGKHTSDLDSWREAGRPKGN